MPMTMLQPLILTIFAMIYYLKAEQNQKLSLRVYFHQCLDSASGLSRGGNLDSLSILGFLICCLILININLTCNNFLVGAC